MSSQCGVGGGVLLLYLADQTVGHVSSAGRSADLLHAAHHAQRQVEHEHWLLEDNRTSDTLSLIMLYQAVILYY